MDKIQVLKYYADSPDTHFDYHITKSELGYIDYYIGDGKYKNITRDIWDSNDVRFKTYGITIIIYNI